MNWAGKKSTGEWAMTDRGRQATAGDRLLWCQCKMDTRPSAIRARRDRARTAPPGVDAEQAYFAEGVEDLITS